MPSTLDHARRTAGHRCTVWKREILSEKRGTSDMVRLDYRMWQ